MDIQFEDDPEVFLKRAADFLMRREAVNNLPLSLAQRMADRLSAGERPVFRSFTALHDGEVVALALQTPPHNLVLSHYDDVSAMEELARFIAAAKTEFPGIVGPGDAALRFSDHWRGLSGRRVDTGMRQLIYAVTQDGYADTSPDDGAFALAGEGDLDTVARWMAAFSIEALPRQEHKRAEEQHEAAARRIADGGIGLWRDAKGVPVSMACVSGVTAGTARIGGVFTPVEARKRGYAGGVVSGLTWRLFDEGIETCCLYTDRANPTSNAIYRRIGYAPVSESLMLLVKG